MARRGRGRPGVAKSERNTSLMAVTIMVVMVVGLALSYGSFHLFRQLREDGERRYLGEHARHAADTLKQALEGRLLLLDHLHAHLVAAAEVGPPRFLQLLQDHRPLMPGLRSLGWMSVVEGRPADAEPLLHPILFVEPLAGSEHLLGYDVTATEERRAAVRAARDTASVTALPPAAMLREGLVMFLLPVYEGGEPPAAVAERRRLFRGAITAAFAVADLIGSALDEGMERAYGVSVLVPTAAGEVTVYSNRPAPVRGEAAEHSITAADAIWRLIVAPLQRQPSAPPPEEAEWRAALLGGVLTVALLVFLVVLFTRARKVEDLVQAVTRTNLALRQEVAARSAAEDMLNRLNARLLAEVRERELAERALRRSEDLFRRALAPTGVVVFAQDADLRYTWVYNSASGEDVGRTDAERLPPADAAVLIPLKRQVLETGVGIRETVHLDLRGGTDLDLTLEPLLDDTGRLVGITGTAVDVTAVSRARAEAERANAAKSRFLAAASHDLRQPLVALRLFVELLTETLSTDEQKAYAVRASDSLAATENLLNTLMDVSALEAGKIKPQIRPVVLNELVDRIADECQAEALAKQIALRSRHCHRGQCATGVHTDPVLLERILRNLVSNALRYTPGGLVLIASRCRRGAALIEVWDNGVGIPEDKLEHIFEDFYQIPHATVGGGIGLGLGLSTVARMARLLGYRIEVKSRVGKGSMFRLVIPLIDAVKTATPQAVPTADAGLVAGRVVAVVEDDPSQLMPLVTVLRKWGCRVYAGRSGDEIEAALAEAALVEVIVTDYWLGDETGFEAIARIRRLAGRHIPAIVLTGDTDAALAAAALDAGHRLIRKPFSPDALRGAIDDLLRPPMPKDSMSLPA